MTSSITEKWNLNKMIKQTYDFVEFTDGWMYRPQYSIKQVTGNFKMKSVYFKMISIHSSNKKLFNLHDIICSEKLIYHFQ